MSVQFTRIVASVALNHHLLALTATISLYAFFFPISPILKQKTKFGMAVILEQIVNNIHNQQLQLSQLNQ